jgi:glycosyltransferase involved in cell wall biosynthesis
MHLLTAIPVYNEEEYLEPVLAEVLRHARDVLVVDDGSTDRTSERLRTFPIVRTIRHPRNLGYGAGLCTAFRAAIEGGYDGLVTLDCDGQHEPSRIPALSARLHDADIVSGSRYLEVFDPSQKPPEERRRINVEVTRWLNDCLGLNVTDAFCGFKAYRTTALKQFHITDNGYAMPLQVWVQAAACGLTIEEVAVPLIYLDESRAFGGALDDAEFRLGHYRRVFQEALDRAGLVAAGGCLG